MVFVYAHGQRQIHTVWLVHRSESVVDTQIIDWLCLGFNDTSTLVRHFVSSPTERAKKKKRDRRDSRGDERRGLGRKCNKNESEETEETPTEETHTMHHWPYDCSCPLVKPNTSWSTE